MVKRAKSGVRAAKADMPGFIKPQLATLKMKAPAGKNRIHEIKYDGYRAQVHVDKGTIHPQRPRLDQTVRGHGRGLQAQEPDHLRR